LETCKDDELRAILESTNAKEAMARGPMGVVGHVVDTVRKLKKENVQGPFLVCCRFAVVLEHLRTFLIQVPGLAPFHFFLA
jgi:hypothetical protein